MGLAWILATACRFGFDAEVTPRDAATVDSPVDADTSDPPAISYHFDEPAGTGTIANAGALDVGATLTMVEQGVPGITGAAVRFASATSGIELADQPVLDNFLQLTIECWVYFDALSSSYSTFVKKEGAYILRTCDVTTCNTDMNRYFSAFVWDSANVPWAAGTIITQQTGVWYHVALTYDGTIMPRELRTYWDGTLADTVSITGGTGPTFDSANALVIGRQIGSGENLRGRIDELRIWSATRTAAQICASAGRTWSGTACL